MPPRSGVGEGSAYSSIVLRPAAGDIRLKIRKQTNRDGTSVVTSGSYESGENIDVGYRITPVPTTDVPRRHSMLARGAGWSSRPGSLVQGEQWDGFATSSNMCTRFGYAAPSGEQTTVAVNAAWGGLVKMIGFNGDLWLIFSSRIAYIPLGTGAVTDYYSNAGDSFTDAEIWNGTLLVAELCTHAGVNIHFFVTIRATGVGTYAAAVNPTPAAPGAAPDIPTVATPQCRLLQTAFWEYQGVAAMRLVAQVGDPSYRYMITPTGSPYDPLNWGATIVVGDTSYAIRRVVSSHTTVWFVKRDGLYAVTDANASAGGENLTPYWADVLDDNDIRINVHYWGQYVVASHAFGIDMVDVNSWQVKDRPRPIAVGQGRPNNTNLNGAYTAFATDNGWLVAAMRDVNSQAVILYGTPRTRESPSAGVTEVDWFPEVGPLTAARDVTALYTFTVAATGRPYLWIGMQDAGGVAYLLKAEGFIGSSPLADTSHRYQTSSSITFTDETWAARSATKGALRSTLAVRNCGSGRKVDLYAVAGAGASFPGSPNATVSTNVEAQTDNLTSVRGATIRTQAVLTSTATVPVVIDEMELRADLGFPLRMRGSWLVEVGEATEGDLPSFETPSTVEAALKALCQSVEAVPCLDDEGTSITVVLLNAMEWRREDGPMTDLGVRQKTRVLKIDYQVIS